MKARELEGYLYCAPYVGDKWILTPENLGKPPRKDSKEYWTRFLPRIREEKDIASLFDGLEGRRIRVRVEVLD